MLAQPAKRRGDIDGAPQHNEVDDQTERAQLIFLSLPAALVKLAALGVKHVARQAMAFFAAIELA